LKDRVKFELYQSEEIELGNNNNRWSNSAIIIV
jgi:hypothetical protein